jgi:hypothetical protein
MSLIPKDWTLLVIAAGHGAGLSPVQLQKSLFLIGQNLTFSRLCVERFYQFKPYDYGPFNSEIYEDAEELAFEGYVTLSSAGRPYRRYSVTDSGLARADEIRKNLEVVSTKYLDDVVGWVRAQTFESLVKSIYKAYPQMRVNSIFQR